MESILQIIVKCFPIATFILFAAFCASKPKEVRRSPARKLTMSTSTLESEKEELNSVEMVLAEEIKKEEKEPENPLINETMSEDRCVACGNKSDSKELKEMVSPDKEKKKEDSKAEQEFVLDETNPHFAFLLAGENRDPAQSVLHAKNAFEHSNGFMWTMKKRLAFDEGCWKHLSRRIGAIRAEGFEVRVNTRQARENKQSADRETKIDLVFNKFAVGKGKKKAGGE